MGPDGSTYEVEAPDEKAAVAGFKRFQSGKFDTAPTTPAEPAKPEPSTGEALARGAKQGVTAEFGDELTGLAKASPVPGADVVNKYFPGPIDAALGAGRLLAEKAGFGSGGKAAYDQAVADERAANAAAQEAHPVASFAGNLGGALLSAPATPMLAPLKGAGIARAAGNLAVTGAAYGGLAGAGAGEGDLVERLPSAVGGAVAGGLLTPPLGGLAAGAGKVGGFVADHIAASRNPQKVSDRIVARAMVEGDKADVGAVRQQMADDQARPAAEVQNLTAADLAGPNTRAAAGNAVRHHGPARTEGQKLLRERQEGSETAFSQADRIDNQLSDIAGPGGSLATEDRILAQRSADGRRLYEGPMAASVDYDSDAGKALLALYDRVPDEAKAAALKILKMEGKAPKAEAAPGKVAALGETGSGGRKPDSLSQFIARNGGLALDGDTADYAHTLRGVGKVVKPNGKSIDGFWRDRLIEEGYLPRDPDGGQARDITDELFDLLERDRAQGGVYPEGYSAKGRARMTREESDHKEALVQEVVSDMAKAGRLDGIDPKIVDRAAEHLAGRHAATGTEAYDMAAATQEAIPSKARQLTARHWDYLKRGLDQLVDSNTDEFGKVNTLGNAADSLRRDVVSATEEAVPGLKEARKVWRGHTEEREALREGAKAFSKPREQVHRDLEELSDTGRELYRLAAINAKKETIAGKGDHLNKAALVGNSPKDREVLQALLPDRETYNRLLGYMRNEKAMFETKAELGNSKTAERLADAADADTPHGLIAAAEAAGHIGTGNWRAAIADIWRYSKKINPEFRAQVLDEVRKVILNPDPQALAAFEARLKADPSLAAPERGRLLKLVAQASTRVAAGQANRPQPAQSGREAPR
jgi:hypothetical protein